MPRGQGLYRKFLSNVGFRGQELFLAHQMKLIILIACSLRDSDNGEVSKRTICQRDPPQIASLPVPRNLQRPGRSRVDAGRCPQYPPRIAALQDNA